MNDYKGNDGRPVVKHGRLVGLGGFLQKEYVGLDAEYCLFDAEYCLLNADYGSFETNYCLLDGNYCLLDTDYCLLDTDYGSQFAKVSRFFAVPVCLG